MYLFWRFALPWKRIDHNPVVPARRGGQSDWLCRGTSRQVPSVRNSTDFHPSRYFIFQQSLRPIRLIKIFSDRVGGIFTPGRTIHCHRNYTGRWRVEWPFTVVVSLSTGGGRTWEDQMGGDTATMGLLPTIKCSNCHTDVEISAMGDHVCRKGTQGRSTLFPSPSFIFILFLVPDRNWSWVRKWLTDGIKASLTRAQTFDDILGSISKPTKPTLPPIDPSAASKSYVLPHSFQTNEPRY